MKSLPQLAFIACVAVAGAQCAHAQVEMVKEPFRASTAPVVPVAPFKPAEVKKPVQRWAVDVQDITLAKSIERWAATAGWRVRWDADKHVLISAPAVYEGAFEDAVAAVLATPGIRRSPYPLEACIYQNTPPLLRITRMGDQVNECPAD
jgi:hypothetical protein